MGLERAAKTLARHRTKVDAIFEALQAAILSGELAPGQRLKQKELAVRLGVSPTPVREALQKLEARGLLVRVPHSGVRVARVCPEEIVQVYRIRAVLEGLAARLAIESSTEAELNALVERLVIIQKRLESKHRSGRIGGWMRLNDEFHDEIVRAAKCPRLLNLVSDLRVMVPRDRFGLVPGQLSRTIPEHQQIIDAIRAKDPDRAESAVRAHVEASGRFRARFLASVFQPEAEPVAP